MQQKSEKQRRTPPTERGRAQTGGRRPQRQPLPWLMAHFCRKSSVKKQLRTKTRRLDQSREIAGAETFFRKPPPLPLQLISLFFCCRQMEPEPSSVALQLQVSELIWPPCGGRIGFGCAEDNHPGWEDWTLPGRRESQSERPSISSPSSHSGWARPRCNLKNSVA